MPTNVADKLKDANYEGEWQSCDLMGESARNYRAPFKVYQALWNPSIDLVALASKKGEICVRRYFWKRGWKRDIFEAKSLLDERTQQQGDTRLQTMCWSPNGKVLAAALHDGSIHLLDTEKGFIRYSIKMKDKICLMKWYSLPYKSPKIDNDQVAGIVSYFFHRLFVGEMTPGHHATEKSTEKPTENDYLKNLKEFCETESFENIIGTVMVCADEERIVHILAAGLLPIARIEPPSKYFVNSDPYSISIGDLIYSSHNERLYVVYSSMAQADTSSMTYSIIILITYSNYVTMSTIWLHLYYSLSYISETFSRMIVDWDEQSAAFESAFDSFNNSNSSSSNDTSSPSLADCLLNIILNGHSNANLLSFFRNSFTTSECKKMNEWINKGFTQLIETLNGDLYCAAQMFQHHMKQFVWEFECVTSKWRSFVTFLIIFTFNFYFALISIYIWKCFRKMGVHHSLCLLNHRRIFSTQFVPNRVFDVSVYPYGSYLLEEDRDESELDSGLDGSINASEMLTLRVVELSVVALKNRKDLSNFMQWLSQTPWLSSRSKSSNSSQSNSSKVNLDAVLEYITQTLGASKTPLLTSYNKEESPGLVEQMDEIFKNIISNNKNANSVFAEAIAADNECEVDKDRSKPHYSFDKVKQYLSRFDRLKHPIDLSNNEWTTPELTTLLMNDNRNTTLTLAQSISECIGCLDKIRASLLSKFSSTVETKSNVFVELLHSEGFERFNFFSLHSSGDEYENDEAKEYMEKLSGIESIGLSCIGSEGRRHCIYTCSGDLISQVKYVQHEDSLTSNAKMSSSTRSVSLKGASVKSGRGERRRSSSDNNLAVAATTAAAVNQPLQIDFIAYQSPDYCSQISAEIPSSKIHGGNCFAVVKNRRIIQFEWLDSGIYYALMKVKRNQEEYVHLTRAFIGDKTIWAHEVDTSCIEHYSSFSLSPARKLGLTLSECGTRVRWFEIGSCAEEHNDEEPEADDNVFANQINETKENINTSPTLNNEVFH
ncbi:unnamed protein product [Anisakis simplex]|uniref:Anaphase-promoting complex subunit 4 n=1 Tax=Anisakis simplex TaxID=6269 RepID=A0A0M3JX70_ANISI|nr:unnamed protein product [Anisakis simplex]